MKLYPLTPARVNELNQLLISENLPLADLNHPQTFYFYIQDEEGKIAGAIGLEIYGRYGLLRSLVVRSDCRNNGLAGQLVSYLIRKAVELNVGELYLLTTTAVSYFEKINFKKVQRDLVPEDIRKSSEFSTVCPFSAIVMRKTVS